MMRLKVMPGYKQTEVGVIPEDWEVKQVGAVASFVNGKAHETWIADFGNYIVVNSKFISTDGEVKKYSDKNLCLASKGQILMVMSDVPNGRAIARCFLVEYDDLYTVNQRICALDPLGVDSKFLFYKLDRNPFYLLFDDGVKQTNLRKADVLACPLSLPATLAEQRAIAFALSDADALLTALDALIAKKRLIKQGAMQELLTGKKRLPEFSGKWEERQLGDIFDITAGGDFDPSLSSEIQNEKFPYPVYSNAITDKGLFGFCSYNSHKAGSITVTARGTLGVANYRDHEFSAIGRVIVLKPSQAVDGRFFSEFINNRIEFVIESTGVPQLTAPQISKYELLMPVLAEQTAIAAILNDLDAEIAALEQRREKTRLLKHGMMQELLTGRIRLV